MNAFIDVISKMVLFLLIVILVIFVAYPLIRVITKAAFRSYFETKQEYDDNNPNTKEKEKKNEIQ